MLDAPADTASPAASAAHDAQEDAARAWRPPRMLAVTNAPAIQLSWLIKLRWVAACGQAITIAAAQVWLSVPLPLIPLIVLIAVTAATNLAAWGWARRAPPTETFIGGLLALDVALLTGLLYWTGGPSNPFSVLYLVHVALAAVMLRPAWTWSMAVAAAAAFGALFVHHVPLAAVAHQHDHASGTDAGFDLHLQGMWAAYAVGAVLVAFFVTRVTIALREREEQLAQARDLTARAQRLASLGTLAAGAAHELGSPMGTIAVAAKELERRVRLLDHASAAALLEDAQLIAQEVRRCRGVLDRMTQQGGSTMGETLERLTAAQLHEAVRAALPAEQAARLRWRDETRGACVAVPRRGLTEAISNLVRNAFSASRADQDVELVAERAGGYVRFAVRDRGFGMSPEVLEHASEPFFTTREPGHGMGLGLFLARTLAESLGGQLALQSVAGQGTTAALVLPVLADTERQSA